jgi:rare lipoprotein A
MPISRVLLSVFFLTLPVSAAAEGITRREGFVRIWETVQRPAYEARETPYIDVPEGAPGFLEITYAKDRGLLDDQESFYPNDAMTKADAAMWLFRTRNVDDVDDMEREDLPVLLERYSIVQESELSQTFAGIEELDALISSFNTMLHDEVHEISFYSEKFHGDGTAFGEKFDMYALTAAHRTFPYNTLVRVTNLDNGKEVVVRVNDRGPFVEGRSMDLSLAAFLVLTERSSGVLRNVRIERLGDSEMLEGKMGTGAATCVPKDEPTRRYQQRITRDVRLNRGVPHTFTVGETLVLDSTKFFVIRSVTYPDGYVWRAEQWIGPEEQFRFTPEQQGEHVLLIATPIGRQRDFRMQVGVCVSE